MRDPAQSWLLAILVGAAGLGCVIGPSVLHGRIPADLADGRLNAYLLEHFHLWIMGKVRHFWSAPIFYPYPLSIAFSDNFLGDGIIYSLLRSGGLGRADAFRLWYVAGFIINFAAALYVLIRLGYSRLGSALGAFLFTFGMPITAQEGHSQLVYRFGVPLAMLALLQVRGARPLLQFGLVAFWTTWQFYCSIYIGYFLVLLLTAVVVSRILCWDNGPIAGIRAAPIMTISMWRGSSLRDRLAFCLAIAALTAMLILLFRPYLIATHIYDFRRSWEDISTMLPRPASYLFSDNSLIWPSSGPLFVSLPVPFEQALFIGITPYLAVMVGSGLRLTRRSVPDRRFVTVAVAILLLVALTLWVDGFTLYRPVAALPGPDAIRAVSRIVLAMLFPAGLLVASSFDAIMAARLPALARYGTFAGLALMLVLEASLVRHSNISTERQWRARMAAVAALLPEKLPADPILLLAPLPNEAWYYRAVDAMLFAQDRGWRTINGYSGNFPPGYEIPITCQQGFHDLVSGLTLLHREREYPSLARHVVMLGYPSTCHNTTPR